MGYSVVKINGMPTSTQLVEYIIDSESDISSLPTGVADGSTAYTKDLSKIYLFKNGSWTEVEDGPSDAQIKQAVDDWLDEHPEATTTVEDGAINYAKLDNELKAKADDVDELKSHVTPEMYGAKGDGITDDTTAINTALNSGMPVKFKSKTYEIRTNALATTSQSVSAPPITPALKTTINSCYNDTVLTELRTGRL